MQDTLTDRQRRFVFEYLIDQNASAAAARAGYSEKWRASAARDLMDNDAVRERIRLEMESLLSELRCTALMLMKERMRAAFFRAGKMFSSGWELLAPEEMEAETRDALEVSTVQRKSGPVVKMKQPDRDRALRALERVHERLDRLNEAHYAKLEKAGKIRSLEEIERMDPEPVVQATGDLPRPARAESGPIVFAQMPGDFVGSAAPATVLAGVFPKEAGGLEGWNGQGRPQPQASAWLLRNPVSAGAPPMGQLRAA